MRCCIASTASATSKGRIVATIAAPDDGEAGAPKVQGDYEAVRELFADILAEASKSTISEKLQADRQGRRHAAAESGRRRISAATS